MYRIDAGTERVYSSMLHLLLVWVQTVREKHISQQPRERKSTQADAISPWYFQNEMMRDEKEPPTSSSGPQLKFNNDAINHWQMVSTTPTIPIQASMHQVHAGTPTHFFLVGYTRKETAAHVQTPPPSFENNNNNNNNGNINLPGNCIILFPWFLVSCIKDFLFFTFIFGLFLFCFPKKLNIFPPYIYILFGCCVVSINYWNSRKICFLTTGIITTGIQKSFPCWKEKKKERKKNDKQWIFELFFFENVIVVVSFVSETYKYESIAFFVSFLIPSWENTQ